MVVMGKGAWLELTGITPERACVYRAIADGTETIEGLRSGVATRVARHREASKNSLRNEENGNRLTAITAITKTAQEPAEALDQWRDPDGTAATLSLFVVGADRVTPEEVWPHFREPSGLALQSRSVGSYS